MRVCASICVPFTVLVRLVSESALPPPLFPSPSSHIQARHRSPPHLQMRLLAHARVPALPRATALARCAAFADFAAF